MASSSFATLSSTVPSASELVDLDGLVLADAVGAVGGLVLDGRVPPAVVVHDVGGAGEVESGARRLQRQQEHRHLTALEAVDHLLAPGDGGGAVQEEGGDAALGEVPLQQSSPSACTG